MKVITNIHNYTPVPCAATIGSFDGVHLGHSSMLEELRTKADEMGLPTMVITFARHPRILFGKAIEPFILSDNDEKKSLFESLGIDYCVMLDFDSQMASMTAERFMDDILSKRLGVELLCIGYDHSFGKPQKGVGFEQYIEYGKRLGMKVFKASPFYVDEQAVSSSKVRNALTDGNISLAGKMLGRDYCFTGKIVHGAGIGHKLGFPTANIQLHDGMKMLPADGVYDVRVLHMDKCYKGVMNIGVKPTIGENLGRTVEVHIIDFEGDIYGTDICVSLKRRLRGEMNFENIEALRKRINTDVEMVKKGI